MIKIFIVGDSTYLDPIKLHGLSTETKPALTKNRSGSSYYCVDTQDFYYWYWNDSTSTGAWYLQ